MGLAQFLFVFLEVLFQGLAMGVFGALEDLTSVLLVIADLSVAADFTFNHR